MEMSKCTRCAMEQGFNPLKDDRRCIWIKAGTVCPDYDERPDMGSIACEKVPDDGTEILRRQMKLLAEKSRFQSADKLVEVSEVMLKLHRHLLIQPVIRHVGVHVFLGLLVGAFAALRNLFQGRR